MIKIFKILLVFTFLIILLLGLYAKSDRQPPKYIYKIASDAPDGSSWVNTVKDVGRTLYKETKGEIGIRIYPGSIMGDQSTVLKKIKIGQLDGCTFSSGGLSLIYKDSVIMGFPMVFKSYEEYDYVRDKMSGFFEKEFEKNGFILLGWSEVGFIYLFSKKRVYNVPTLKNSKPYLVEGDTISLELFKEIGATPVPIQISDVMTGLQTGLIDTVFGSPYTMIALQWFTKVKYMASMPLTLMIGAILVDKDTFNSMPEDYQKRMKTLFTTKFDGLNKKVRQDNVNAMTSLKKNGLEVIPVEKEDEKLFLKVTKDVADRLTEKEYSRDLLNEIRKHVNDFNGK